MSIFGGLVIVTLVGIFVSLGARWLLRLSGLQTLICALLGVIGSYVAVFAMPQWIGSVAGIPGDVPAAFLGAMAPVAVAGLFCRRGVGKSDL